MEIYFSSIEHKDFHYTQLAKCKYNDCYHRALIYALGITEDIRKHFKQVYDIEDDSIKPNCVNSDWVTGSDKRILKLAFNLFNDYNKCDVSDVFSYDAISEYLLYAIALRYEMSY